MGNKQPVKGNETDKELIINHPQFHKVKTIKEKDSTYLQISSPVVNENEIKQWTSQYKKYISWDCLLLPSSQQYKGAKMCGNSGSCFINYDYFPFLLGDEISDRCESTGKKYFDNVQLWYLVFTIVEAAHVFHMSGRKVGDIRPLNIFINDHGQAKVANHLSWPNEESNFEKYAYHKEITYIAPEEVVDLNFGKNQPRSHFEISQAFSMGLTLLDSAILSNSKDLYNMVNHRFNYERLDNKVKELFSLRHIDSHLKSIIAGLCHSDPSIRLTSRMVYEELHKHKERICELQPFQFKEIPSFLGNPVFQQPQVREPITRSPSKVIVQQPQQPAYIESQVVSNSPQQVLFAREEKKIIHHPTPVKNQEIRNQQTPVQFNREPPHVQYVQVNRQVKSPPQPVQVIRDVRPEQFVVEKRFEEEKKFGIPSRQIGPSQVVQPYEVPQSVSETKYISRPVEVEVKTMAEKKELTTPGTNYDDFRSTLEKIEEQLALSRRMYPSEG